MTVTEITEHAPGLVRRFFTSEGVHPYDEVEWELRDAYIPDFKKTQAKINRLNAIRREQGEPELTAEEIADIPAEAAFEQKGVEFPASWSLNASNIVAQKYFRGQIGSPAREHSLREVIDRVADTITAWGIERSYFDEEEGPVFNHELKHLLVHQKGSFNSPVWFNIGAPGRPQQASACFILDVIDDMNSIKEWVTTEADIFRGGSGSGANLSFLREDGAPLSRGGKASGPVSFMRWADSGAGAIKSAGETRRAAKMVILNADHPDIEDFIWCKALEERKARDLRALRNDDGTPKYDLDLNGRDAELLQYQNANNSVRVTDEFMQAVVDDGDWDLVSRVDGSIAKTVKARWLMGEIAKAAHECADPGVQFHTTINLWNTTPTLEELDGSNPCSEHIRRRNSSCNLASINLLKFLDEEGNYDQTAYEAAVEVIFTAQDILIEKGDFPTEKIKQVTHADRDLGLGYANLGALLMANGLPYDSDEGRLYAALMTGLTTGTAYRRSTEMAARLGPCPSFEGDRDGAIAVMEMHLAAAERLVEESREFTRNGVSIPGLHNLAHANLRTWEQVVEGAKKYGLRNAQATVLAPTGTISFMMDCDTTGMEPDLGLKKTKKLVGGGTLSIVNQTVPRALRRLGYEAEEIAEIVAYIDQNASVLGAPHIKAEHLPVFACSMGDNTIGYMGHILMMGKIQPQLAGAMSKTVNMPEDATVEDVFNTYVEAWSLGIKCLALYVDNSKVAQPLSVDKANAGDSLSEAVAGEGGVTAATEQLVAELRSELEKAQQTHYRRKLPHRRHSETYKFSVADMEGYMTVGQYEDGQPGEIFIKLSKQGSTLAGVFDAFSIAISIALQFGAPLAVLVEKFTGMKFEPAGMVQGDEDLKMALSVMDYLFRRMAIDHLPFEVRASLGIFTVPERVKGVDKAFQDGTLDLSSIQETEAAPISSEVSPNGFDSNVAVATEKTIRVSDAPYCYSCGNQMQRAGSCYACSCGTTSGCS